jgi:hypothetical protein
MATAALPRSNPMLLNTYIQSSCFRGSVSEARALNDEITPRECPFNTLARLLVFRQSVQCYYGIPLFCIIRPMALGQGQQPQIPFVWQTREVARWLVSR